MYATMTDRYVAIAGAATFGIVLLQRTIDMPLVEALTDEE